jgi:hypothetical protein
VKGRGGLCSPTNSSQPGKVKPIKTEHEATDTEHDGLGTLLAACHHLDSVEIDEQPDMTVTKTASDAEDCQEHPKNSRPASTGAYNDSTAKVFKMASNAYESQDGQKDAQPCSADSPKDLSAKDTKMTANGCDSQKWPEDSRSSCTETHNDSIATNTKVTTDNRDCEQRAEDVQPSKVTAGNSSTVNAYNSAVDGRGHHASQAGAQRSMHTGNVKPASGHVSQARLPLPWGRGYAYEARASRPALEHGNLQKPTAPEVSKNSMSAAGYAHLGLTGAPIVAPSAATGHARLPTAPDTSRNNTPGMGHGPPVPHLMLASPEIEPAYGSGLHRSSLDHARTEYTGSLTASHEAIPYPSYTGQPNRLLPGFEYGRSGRLTARSMTRPFAASVQRHNSQTSAPPSIAGDNRPGAEYGRLAYMSTQHTPYANVPGFATSNVRAHGFVEPAAWLHTVAVRDPGMLDCGVQTVDGRMPPWILVTPVCDCTTCQMLRVHMYQLHRNR